MVLKKMALNCSFKFQFACRRSPGLPGLTTQGFQQWLVPRLADRNQPDVAVSSEKPVSGSWKRASHSPPEASVTASWLVFCSRIRIPLPISTPCLLSLSHTQQTSSFLAQKTAIGLTEVVSPVHKEEEDGSGTIRALWGSMQSDFEQDEAHHLVYHQHSP